MDIVNDPRLGRQRPTAIPVPGRPSRVDRASIAAAALRVGFDKLSMTAVAAELGVAHPTLYRHVCDRNDLITAADLLLRNAERPQPAGGWRDYLRRSAFAVFEVIISAPGMIGLPRPDRPGASVDRTGGAGLRTIGLDGRGWHSLPPRCSATRALAVDAVERISPLST